MNAPSLSDVNDTPYDRYVIYVSDCLVGDSDTQWGFDGFTPYFYFIEDAYNEYEMLLNHYGANKVIFVVQEVGQRLSNALDDFIAINNKSGALPIPVDRKWDVRDGCFPAVLFPEKGA